VKTLPRKALASRNPKTPVSFQAEEADVQRMDKAARHVGMSRAELIRRATMDRVDEILEEKADG